MDVNLPVNHSSENHLILVWMMQMNNLKRTWSRSGNISASPHSPWLPCLSNSQVAPDLTVLGSTDNPTLGKKGLWLCNSYSIICTWARGPLQPLQVHPQQQQSPRCFARRSQSGRRSHLSGLFYLFCLFLLFNILSYFIKVVEESTCGVLAREELLVGVVHLTSPTWLQLPASRAPQVEVVN